MNKVLIAGESWMSHTTHVKGFDTFYTSVYEEGVKWLKHALEKGGYEVDFLPNHLASEQFPTTADEMGEYSCIILSDIGSNTLLISKDSFECSKPFPNRCDEICKYVKKGGSLLMIGGYMSFSGIDAKARYGQTSISDILPVGILDIDDRVESPQGVKPILTEHKLFEGINGEWPAFLGYNKTKKIMEGDIVAAINGDPFIALRKYVEGKTAVFTSDCAPHWGPPEFVNWEHYNKLWINIINWLTK